MTTDSAEAPPRVVKGQGATQTKDPKTPNTPQTPKTTNAPKAPKSSKAASTPKEPNSQGAPDAPQALQAPKTPEESKTSSEPNTPKPSNKPKKPKTPMKPKTPKAEIEPKIDAFEYHAALAKAPKGHQYEYDPKLTAEGCRKHDVRNMSGRFVCSPCKSKKQHTWGSGVICTRLFLSRTNTYRAEIYGQKCKRCSKYGKLELDVEKYVAKVLDAFELWRGLREARAPEHHASTGPHESSLCHGCELGYCTKNDDDVYNYNSNNNNKYLSSFVRGRY